MLLQVTSDGRVVSNTCPAKNGWECHEFSPELTLAGVPYYLVANNVNQMDGYAAVNNACSI